VQIVQLRWWGSLVRWALEVTYIHPPPHLRLPRAFQRWEDRAQTPTEVLNDIASAGPSSLATMVAFNTAVPDNRLLVPFLEEEIRSGHR